MNSRAYVPFAIVALLAGTIGWGASTLTNKQTAEAMPSPIAPQALVQPQVQPEFLPEAQSMALQPVQTLQPITYSAQPVAPVARATAASTRTVSQPASVTRNTSGDYSPAPVRKKGMSNKTKTVIAVGTGAGVGAAIGGIAKGGKGAAIGAIAGGGAGAVYSWIKHKKNQPVF